MTFLGIPLRTPTARDWAILAICISIYSGGVLLAEGLDWITADTATAVLIGMCAGALVRTFGASVQEHGWRAMLLALTFYLLLGALCALLLHGIEHF